MNTALSACVLIADDDEDDRYLLARAFAQYSPGCHLQFTVDGADLLEELGRRASGPSLILLDLNMPRLDGLETLAILRQNPLYQPIPIVVLTTSSAEVDRQRAIELGANDFITKPISGEQLGNIVTRLRAEWLVGVCC